jgi:hypothetical protein
MNLGKVRFGQPNLGHALLRVVPGTLLVFVAGPLVISGVALAARSALAIVGVTLLDLVVGVAVVVRAPAAGRLAPRLDGRISDDGIEPLAHRDAGTACSLARALARLRSDPLHVPRNTKFHARIRMFD